MHFGTKKQPDSGAVPLQSAVLCVDCESVTDSGFDECPLCGSHSLLGLAQMLGNVLSLHKANYPQGNKDIGLFDLEFTIDVEQMELKDLNSAIQHITSLIGTRLVRGRARCHIDVAPVVGASHADENAA
jgi:hypothetical protein